MSDKEKSGEHQSDSQGLNDALSTYCKCSRLTSLFIKWNREKSNKTNTGINREYFEFEKKIAALNTSFTVIINLTIIF